MEAVDKSRTKGIIEMPTIVPDPPRAWGVKAALKAGKERLRQTVGSVTGRTIERMSVGRSAPIQVGSDRSVETHIGVMDEYNRGEQRRD